VAGSSVLARIRLALVHVQLAVLALEAFGALARVRPHQVLASGAVLARCRVALVDLLLAVRTGVAVRAVTPVRITDVFACSVVAEGPQGDALSQRGVLAADHLDVAHFSGPTHPAQALITILDLSARRLVLAGVRGAPVDVLAAVFTCVTIRAMTSVVRRVVLTSGAVQTWRAVAQIDAILTVGTGVAATTRLKNCRRRVEAETHLGLQMQV
jgi:hypothetical protein